jgi:hypothetical protein
MNILATRNRLPDLNEAAERASKWVDLARPIIKAMFAVDDDAEQHVRAAWLDAYAAKQGHHRRLYSEARGYLEKARNELFAMLDGIRDDYLCDECPQQPSQFADEQAWADRDEWNAALAESVTTVEAAIQIVTAEHNREFAL